MSHRHEPAARSLSCLCSAVVVELLQGLVAALLCSFTKLWNNKYKRTFILVACGAQHTPCVSATASQWCPGAIK